LLSASVSFQSLDEEAVLPDLATWSNLNASNFLNNGGKIVLNPNFGLLGLRAIQNLRDIIVISIGS